MRQSNKYIIWGLVKKIRNFHSSRRGKPLKFPRFPVTSVTIHMLLKRGWGNTKGWSMENPSLKICCNFLLHPLPIAWDSPQATVVPWLNQGYPMRQLWWRYVAKPHLPNIHTIVVDVMKYSTQKKTLLITNGLFIQTCVTSASDSLSHIQNFVFRTFNFRGE